MSAHDRAEVQKAIEKFKQANYEAERDGDWSRLAAFYTDDAVYTYVGLAAGGLVEARGRDEIRKLVLQRDMETYRGWTYPFDWIAIDGDRVITKWWNRAPGTHPDGKRIQCPGMSVLEYAGDGRFKSQFDIFDRLSVKDVRDEWERVSPKA
jgi:ketosteroid isomerase-like protein